MVTVFPFYKSYYNAMSRMSDKTLGALMRAVCEYVFEGVVPELTGVCGVAFDLIAPMVTASVRKNKRAAAGARARWNKESAADPPDEAAVPPAEEAAAEAEPCNDPPPPLPENVRLTFPRQDALRREIPDADGVIRRYARYKAEHLAPDVQDEDAIRYFAEHGSVPPDAFLPTVSSAEFARAAIEKLKKMKREQARS